jgi:hypothetical protein
MSPAARHARLAQQEIDRLLSFRRPLMPREQECLANLRQLVARQVAA